MKLLMTLSNTIGGHQITEMTETQGEFSSDVAGAAADPAAGATARPTG